MAFVTWQDMYATGIPSIDEQHRKLVEIINDLAEATFEGKGRQELADILTRLVDYTEAHFTHEEALMEKHEYPQLDEHRRKHWDLTKKVMEFREKHNRGEVGVATALLTFMSEWLTDHVKAEDQKYVPRLKDGGAQ